MNKHEAVIFLFATANDIKHSLEKPVILLTRKDYAKGIYNSLVDMRTTLLQEAEPRRVLDLVRAFHDGWLSAVAEIEGFKKRLRDIPRETVLQAIDFTKESVNQIRKAFSEDVAQLRFTLTEEENSLLQVDLKHISEMQQSAFSVLSEKQKNLSNTVDPEEYYHKVSDEIEELMNWLDSLNDNLAAEFSKIISVKGPRLVSGLTNTLEHMVDEIETKNEDNIELILEMQRKGQKFGFCINASDAEIKDVTRKIQILKGRIDRLKEEDSSAVMALEHKTHYLEERLHSLEDLKSSLITLRSKQEVGVDIKKQDLPRDQAMHVFDHLLPPAIRGRLVEEFINLWTEAICGFKESKSIISILSVTDIKEEFVDELGNFVIDKYGRKVYKSEEDDFFYQCNEKNELVPLNDDDQHVYFFDECGRYYLNEQKERIYKAYENASEYMINREGLLTKHSEIRSGTKYFYDNCGRYYLDRYKKRIYEGSNGRKYENDGFGNLILIRKEEMHYNLPPLQPMVIKENMYLKKVVGEALSTCIANVVVHQPADPILYLADCLVAYRKGQKMREQSLVYSEALMLAREEQRMLQDSDSSEESQSDCGTEATTVVHDQNLVNYKSMEIE